MASESILLTKKEKYTKITEMDTKYNLTCGSCKLSVSKGECKCNLLCVICEERLNKKLVIWCKYCGHGGHAVEYEKHFKIDKKKYCPHGCGHECFST